MKIECGICKEEVESDLIFKEVRESKTEQVVKCRRCHLVQLWPRMSGNEQRDFVNSDMQAKLINYPSDMEKIMEVQRGDVERRASYVKSKINADDKILDVGCGYGFFVQWMAVSGYSIDGYEPSEERYKKCRQFIGTNIYNNVPDETYGCLTFFHVLEHIEDPVDFLIGLKSKLKIGGKIVIEVPNVYDHLVSTNYEYTKHYFQKSHMYYFGVMSLVRVLHLSGYVVKKIDYVQRYGIDNLLSWEIDDKPGEIKMSDYNNWIDRIYREALCTTGKSDTLIMTAEKTSE